MHTFIITASILSAVAAVAAFPVSAPQTPDSCGAGSQQCCRSTSTPSDPNTASLLGLLGIVVQGIAEPVGLDCTPITVVGTGGSSCSAPRPVCCTDGNFNGLMALGCTP